MGPALLRLGDRTAWQAWNVEAEFSGGTMRSDHELFSITEQENNADVSDFLQGQYIIF